MMGPTLAGQVSGAATLAQALRRFCRFVRLESSEMRCWLTVEQEEARFHLLQDFRTRDSRIWTDRMAGPDRNADDSFHCRKASDGCLEGFIVY